MGYYIKVDKNVKIYVEDLNPDGKCTILFIHGWPASQKMFEYQFNQLPQLGFRCIGVDTRGFGKSDRPVCGYDYDRLADDIHCIIKALDLEDITLLGHSTGGAIAVRYMARHKGYGVSKLILCAAAVPTVAQRPNFPYGVPQQTVFDIIKGTYSDRPNMLQGFGNIFFYQHITQAFSDWFFQLGLEAAGWATAEVAKTWLEDDQLFNDLEEICVPTLILHGIHDKVILPPLTKYQHQHIRNSTFIPFRFSGHGLFYDECDKFNREVAQFAGE